MWPSLDEAATECLKALYNHATTGNVRYVKNAATVMLRYAPVAERAWWRALKQRAATATLLPTDNDEATTRIRRMLGLE